MNKNEQGINVVDLFVYMLSKWKWFLLSIVICGGVAWFLYARAPFVYFRSATVIIKDPSNKTSTAGLDRYDNYINRVNVANEILQFRSKRLMREVVQRLHVDVSYQIKDGLRYDELYARSPVTVSFLDVLPKQSVELTVTPVDRNSVSVVVPGLTKEEAEKRYTVKMNDTVAIRPNVRICVTPTNFYAESWRGVPIRVRKQPLDAMIAYYRGSVGIRQEEEESSILTLSLKDSSPIRAEDVLNMLITVYNEEAIKDKNQVAVKSRMNWAAWSLTSNPTNGITRLWISRRQPGCI